MRKGFIEHDFLIELLLFAATAIILMALMVIVVNNFSTKETCRFSAKVQLATSLGPLNSPFELVCPRKFLHVEGEKIARNDFDLLTKLGRESPYFWLVGSYDEDEEIKIEQKNKLTDENFQQELTEIFGFEMVECWDTFLDGRHSFLDESTVWGRKNTCVVCAEIYLERENIQPFTMNLASYLNARPHHLLDRTSSETMGEYLYNAEAPSLSSTCKYAIWPDGTLPIENEESYAVLYGRMSGGSLNRFGRFTAQHPILRFTAIPITIIWDDRQDFCQSVFVAPTNEIPNYCNILVN